MSRLADSLYVLVVTAWAGALWSIGAISAPTLFRHLPDSTLAGTIAGSQFAIVDGLGIGCAAYLIVYLVAKRRGQVWASLAFWLTVAVLLLTLIGHFGTTPVIEQLRADPARQIAGSPTHQRFQIWHGLASILWLVQCGLAAALVVRGPVRAA